MQLASSATLEELANVLTRPKFEHYLTSAEAFAFVRLTAETVELVDIHIRIPACRDPADDKFLEAAVNGEADTIVTGDDDLLALDPFDGIPILRPAAFLTRFAEP